ncbi:MAG: AAA domain-containing protein [Myxococcales bacterium]|nr:AAA domain-containing protein [Myxococcales bacterium]
MVDLRQFDELHSVHAICILVREWWQLEVAYADASGYVLDHADGNIFPSGNEFCRKALGSQEGFRRCNESLKAVSERLKSGRQRSVIVRQCHLGFDVVAAPIRFGGELVGFIFAGGALHEEPRSGQRSELFSSVREFSDGAQSLLEHALSKVPRTGQAERGHLASMIEYAAAEIMKVQGGRESHSSTIAPSSQGDSVSALVQTKFGNIVGASKSMCDMFGLLEKVVKSEATVLVHGESGTGKELIARAIHFHGPRAKKPFVVQNCSAFNDNLLESALFGHIRGAFSGAVKDQKGLFEMADGGTFFLDEIGDMSTALQVKLLRVLQEGTLTPVGATKPVKVNVRIVAASHKDLGELVKTGQFREDLYYRVNVLRISVPPLRERIEDLPMLVSHFLSKHYHGEGSPPVLAADTMAALAGYPWRGNIRELENEMERLNVLSTGDEAIAPSMLSQRILNAMPRDEIVAKPSRPVCTTDIAQGATLRELVEGIESEVIHQGLIRTHWNKSQLAKELGISRSNLIQKCSYYGLERKN